MDSDWIPAGRTRKRGEDEEKNNNWAENVNKRSSEEERKMGGGRLQLLLNMEYWKRPLIITKVNFRSLTSCTCSLTDPTPYRLLSAQ